MELVNRYKTPTAITTKILFNQKDTCIALISQDGFVNRYTLMSGQFYKLGEGIIDKQMQITAGAFIDHLSPETEAEDEFKLLLAGSEQSIGNFRIYDKKERRLEKFNCGTAFEKSERPTNSLTDLVLAKSYANQIRGVFTGTPQGRI